MGRYCFPPEHTERERVEAIATARASGWSHSPRTKMSYGSNFCPPEYAIRDDEDLSHISKMRRERLAMLGIGT